MIVHRLTHCRNVAGDLGLVTSPEAGTRACVRSPENPGNDRAEQPLTGEARSGSSVSVGLSTRKAVFSLAASSASASCAAAICSGVAPAASGGRFMSESPVQKVPADIGVVDWSPQA